MLSYSLDVFCQEVLRPMKDWVFICKWIFSFYTKAKISVQSKKYTCIMGFVNYLRGSLLLKRLPKRKDEHEKRNRLCIIPLPFKHSHYQVRTFWHQYLRCLWQHLRWRALKIVIFYGGLWSFIDIQKHSGYLGYEWRWEGSLGQHPWGWGLFC